MCFTVEIDEKQFPDAPSFFNRLHAYKILFVTDKSSKEHSGKDNICYRIEIDSNKSLQIVGNILAEMIKQDYLKKYADNIIKSDYISVSISDRENIVETVIEYTDTSEIADLICEYIKSNNHMHLSGFVLFRMRDFINSFEDEIDFAIDEFIEGQRHKDFVKFLKFFISIQESEFDEINLILLNDLKYYLLDGKGTPINKNLLDSSHCEISTLEDSSSYLMINDLVALAPKHIVLHCGKEESEGDIAMLVKEIFESRVSVCHCCNLCKNKHKTH